MEENKKKGLAKLADEEGFDVTGLLLDYLAHWKWFVLCGVIAVAIAYYKYSCIVPVYQVSASIYLTDDKTSASNAISMSGVGLVNTKTDIDQTELEILKSRNSVIEIVDSLNLAYSYSVPGTFRSTPIYRSNAVTVSLDSIALKNLGAPISANFVGDGTGKYDIKVSTHFGGVLDEKEFKAAELPLDVELSQGTLHIVQTPGRTPLNGKLDAMVNNPRAVAGGISAGLGLAFNMFSTSIIQITYNTPVIEQGIDVVNALINLYNKQIIEDKNRSAIQTEAFIIDRLELINNELQGVETRLQEYRQKHNIVDISTQAGMNLSAKTSYETELTQMDAEMRLLDDVERMVSSADIYETLPSAVSNTTVSSLIDAYNRKVVQLNRTLQTSTPDNPLVAQMQEDLTVDKQRILQNIGAVRRNMVSRRGTIASLENRSAGELSTLPPIDRGLQEIFREQQVKVNIYSFLLQRREEIALQKTLATNTARLIDNPVGYGPVAPDRNKMLLIGLLIGLLIPALIIFLRRLIFPIFKDQEELERLTKVPILGEICKIEKPGENEIVVGENVATPVAELFRLMRNNIGFTPKSNDNKVILVTSAISGEGKTFVAVNLAMTYALTGKRVVVVGLDIRRPTLAHRFKFNNHKGVTTFLSGQTTNLDELIHQTKENPNLYVLPAGPLAPNPNELLMAPTMERMIRELRREFDYVIIDSAPVGIISDTFLVVHYTDLQIFVTRANYSSARGLKVLHQAVEQNKFTKAYIVLNGVNITSNSYLYRRYGNYGHYGQKGQAYGYGYTSKAPREESSK